MLLLEENDGWCRQKEKGITLLENSLNYIPRNPHQKMIVYNDAEKKILKTCFYYEKTALDGWCRQKEKRITLPKNALN